MTSRPFDSLSAVLPRLAAAALAVLLAAAPLRSLQAQAPPPDSPEALAQVYNTSMQAFARGDFQTCTKGLEQIIAVSVDESQRAALQPIFFTLGAAYFNTPDYPKAIEVFKKYIGRYPAGDKLLEVRLALAQAYLLTKSFDEAIKLYQQLESTPAFREQALSAQAQAYRELGKTDDAIRVLEALAGTELRTAAQANAAIQLAELYADQNKPEKSIVLLDKLRAKTGIVENVVALNSLAVKLADEFAEKKLYKEALSAYRTVLPRNDVIRFQNDRIAAMERRIDANVREATGNAQFMVRATQLNNQIKAALAEAKQLLEQFNKLPDFAPALLFRMARCYSEWEKNWEALAVYERILLKYPEAQEREPALFAKVLALGDLNQPASCQKACEAYLKEFPTGPNAGTVGYLSGAVALQVQDYKGAESFFGIMLERQPDSQYRAEMRYLLGNARFMQGKYDDALKDYQRYLKDHPTGENVEEVVYRVGLTHLFTGRYEQAMEALSAYLGKYAQGTYVSDAKYRLTVCKYAAEQYPEAVVDCREWLRSYPGDQIEGEVHALLGDALAAGNKIDEAIVAYRDSYRKATTDEVLNYSLFETSKHLQKLGRWEEVEKMFTQFVEEKPDHPAVVAAMYWIGRAKARLGRAEEAKTYMVDNLKKYIGEPKREAVEQLLTQLAQLCAKRPRPPAPLEPSAAPAASVSGSAPSGQAAATVPDAKVNQPAEPPPYDPFAELEKQLKPLEESANATAKARLLYAQAELALMKKQDERREKLLREIAERFRPEELSSVLLAQVGEFLAGKGEKDRPTALYQKLMQDFPKSDYLDYAYVGLGELAFERKEYDAALELFTDAVEKISASMKTKEAMLGRAKTLLELGRYEESRKIFEQVASMREWRGESTAYAVYSLGEIAARQGRSAEAIAFFRRVFVAYQKYLPWVAKSYLRAAESFEKMGKRQDAIDNLHEMLKNDKLQRLPEVKEAQKRLREWGAA